MTDSKNGSKSNLNESNMPLLSEEAAEKGGDTPEKEVIEMTETEKVRSLYKQEFSTFLSLHPINTLKITTVPQKLGTTD